MKELKIYFTTDVHGHVFPTDYTDRTVKNMGLLSFGEAVHKDGNTLVMDGGDLLQGAPFVTYLEENPNVIHPLAHVMNGIGYDYIALGNHDFNYGKDYLYSFLDHISAEVLCANVKVTDQEKVGKKQILPYDIRTMANGLRVGIVGVTTDFINIWEKPEHIEGYHITDAFEAAKDVCDGISDKVDVLIGLYHGGFENDLEDHRLLSDSTENQAFKMARELPFDLLLTGHQHMAIANTEVFGTHLIQSSANGVLYAEIHVTVEENNTVIHSELKSPKAIEADCIDPSLIAIEERVQQWLDTSIGQLDAAMTVKDHMTMALEGNTIVNFLSQVQLWASGAEVSCCALANKVMGLPEKVTLRDVVSTYVYPNTLVVIEVTGAILKKALERAAAYFQVSDTGLTFSESFTKPKVAHYNYDYFSGIHYTIDLTRPVGDRITSVTYKDSPLSPDETLKLVMNNYRVSGTGGYEFYKDCPVEKEILVTTSEMIADYFKDHPVVTVDKDVYYRVIR